MFAPSETKGYECCGWKATAIPPPEASSLYDETSADIAIIGGGITGASAALAASNAGRSVVVLEASEVGFGASGRNTGWYMPIWSMAKPKHAVARYGETVSRDIMAMTVDGARRVVSLVQTHGIDCCLKPKGVLMAARTAKALHAASEAAPLWRSVGAEIEELSAEETRSYVNSKSYTGALLYRDGGQLNPLSYVRGLARAAAAAGARYFTQTLATGITQAGNGWRIATLDGAVTARKVLIAVGAYRTGLRDGLGEGHIRLRVGMLASSPWLDGGASILPKGVPMTDLDSKDAFAVGFDENRRLVTSIIPSFGDVFDPNKLAKNFSAAFEQTFGPLPSGMRWTDAWDGFEAVTSDKLPHLYRLEEGLFAVVGFSGNGINLATIVGEEAAKLLSGAEACRLPFSPLKKLAAMRTISAFLNQVVIPGASPLLYRSLK